MFLALAKVLQVELQVNNALDRKYVLIFYQMRLVLAVLLQGIFIQEIL
jgi:hypothetical protein